MLLKNITYYMSIGFCFINLSLSLGQDQKVADSLSLVYQENQLSDDEQLELLRNLSFNELHDLDLAMKYVEELIALAQSQNNELYLYRGYLQKGDKYEKIGDFKSALESYFKSIESAIAAKYSVGEGAAYMSIADVYSVMGNSANAEIYYDKAVTILRTTNDSISLASALLNAGDEYLNTNRYEEALANFKEAGNVFREVNYPSGLAYALGNTGMVHAKQGDDSQAKSNINQAIEILESTQDYYPISVYLTYMADIYANQNDMRTAFEYAERSLDLAKTYGLKEQISEANLKLSELHEQGGNFKDAFMHYRSHIIFRDSIKNLEAIQQMADLRTDFEVSQKQIEVDLLNQQKRNQRIIVAATAVALFLIALLAIGLYRRNKYIQETSKIIEDERNRSDELLLNILPVETAEELKIHGKVKAKKFNSVTVLFTDFEKFTQYSESLSPEDLVESVDFYFSKFDEIIEKYNLEKIKTVGDAYMCAGGLPFRMDDHAHKMVYAALEILDFVNHANVSAAKSKTPFRIRIGINTGPVVAGVVGTKKFAYDIWGDAVNVASRMESNSEPGQINISENTFKLVQHSFKCTYRGEIAAKNRGKMKMYFVEGVKKHASLL